MPKSVTALDIDSILVRWASNELSATDVHNWAEARFATEEWESDNEAINEVLGHLDRLDMNLVVVADVPLLRKALLAPSIESACALIDRCYEIMPIAQRRRDCAQSSLYAPFC